MPARDFRRQLSRRVSFTIGFTLIALSTAGMAGVSMSGFMPDLSVPFVSVTPEPAPHPTPAPTDPTVLVQLPTL
jgi:hypothetical protein